MDRHLTEGGGQLMREDQPSPRAPKALSREELRKRQIAIGVGNFMEWFDFAIYGYFAATIGALFFPTGNSTTEMLSAFAVFAVGFVARPVGALILGPLGDKFGRKLVLVITVMGMGVTTAAMGLVPTYATIGVAAPIMIVVLRSLQGMMVGGEWSSAATYIGENAPSNRRATHGSLITTTAGIAFLVGTGLAAVLNATLSTAALESWGWRLPFIASIVMAGVAVFIRRNLGDTPVFEELEERRTQQIMVVAPRSEKLKAFGISLAFSALFGVGFYYLMTYANNHLSGAVGMPRVSALLACTLSLVVYVFLTPLFGRISDSIGRRPVVLTAAGGIAVLGIPVFMMLNTGNFALVFIGLTVLGIFVAMAGVMSVTLLVEVFPASSRSTGSALGHNVAYALLAGPGPLIAALLIAITGNPLSPAYYLVAIGAAAFLVLFFALPETNGKDITEG
ncbi:MFS transporter [Leucobacter sp. HY1908]